MPGDAYTQASGYGTLAQGPLTWGMLILEADLPLERMVSILFFAYVRLLSCTVLAMADDRVRRCIGFDQSQRSSSPICYPQGSSTIHLVRRQHYYYVLKYCD
jgi:hypothetical protein